MMDSLRLMAGIGSRGGAETRRWGDAEVGRRGGGEMSVEALGRLSSRSAFFFNAPSWGLAFPGGAADLMI